MLSIEDQSQKLNVQLRIRQREEWNEETEPEEYTLTGEVPQAQEEEGQTSTKDVDDSTTKKAPNASSSPTMVDDVEDVLDASVTSTTVNGTSNGVSGGTKRKQPDTIDEADQDGDATQKKAKHEQTTTTNVNSSTNNDDDDVIELD